MSAKQRRSSFFLTALSLVLLGTLGYSLYRLVRRDIFTGSLSAMDLPHSTNVYRPRGASALYDSLDQMPGLSVSRNTKPLLRMKPQPQTTVVLLGVSQTFFEPDTFENFDRFEKQMRGGTHYLILLDPSEIKYFDAEWSDKNLYHPWSRSSPDKSLAELKKENEALNKELKLDKILPQEKVEEETKDRPTDRWGFRFYHQESLRKQGKDKEGLKVVVEGIEAEDSATWYTAWSWGGLSPEWQTLAQVQGRPVVIRREFGQGSLTLVSDSAFASNQSLIKEPSAGFIWWLFGGQKRLIFEETLHGAAYSASIVGYVRSYGLAGFFIGLLVLVGLFIWRGASSLVPSDPAHDYGHTAQRSAVLGRGSLEGLATQLREVVPRQRLLTACVDQWARSRSNLRRHGEEKIAQLRQLSLAKGKWADRYRAIIAEMKTTRPQ
jgi:hypothetical protein